MEDFHAKTFANKALTSSTVNLKNMGYADRAALERDADLENAKLFSRYRILATADGERNAYNAIKRLFLEVPPPPGPVEAGNDAEQQSQSRISQRNIDFMKHGAMCSLIEQSNDVNPAGFRAMHQFFNSQQFKHFDPEVMHIVYTI